MLHLLVLRGIEMNFLLDLCLFLLENVHVSILLRLLFGLALEARGLPVKDTGRFFPLVQIFFTILIELTIRKLRSISFLFCVESGLFFKCLLLI